MLFLIFHHSSVKRPLPAKNIETSTELCLYLLEEYNIAAVPGDAFGEPKGIRISYATSMELLEEAMKRLNDGLKALV